MCISSALVFLFTRSSKGRALWLNTLGFNPVPLRLGDSTLERRELVRRWEWVRDQEGWQQELGGGKAACLFSHVLSHWCH